MRVSSGCISTSVGAIASCDSTLPPICLKLSAITCCSCCAYGLPSWMVTTEGTLSTLCTYVASALPCSLSLNTVRAKPSYSFLRVGAVSAGAVHAVQISTIPCCQRIGAPGVAADEQAGPSTITVCGLAASLVAAVWPPSALQPSSSALSFSG